MDELMIAGREGERILSVEDWLAAAPPKRGAAHWRDGYSAKELAKAWFRSGAAAVPAELSALLASNPATAGARVTVAMAEHTTAFDAFPGGKRHHDLLLLARQGADPIVVGVEGKAEEPLGSPVIEMYQAAKASQVSGTSTNLPARIEQLIENLFGRTLDQDVSIGNLRYQLLTASAGTLVEAQARHAVSAALVVHELVRPKTADTITATHLAVADFLTAIDKGSAMTFAPGRLHGPLRINGGGLVPSGIPFFVGLIRP